MGDRLIEAICTVFERNAYDNGMTRSQLRIVVDAMINKLREAMSDDDIAVRFGRADYKD